MQRPIEVSRRIGAEFAHVGEVLSDDPGAAFREAATARAQQRPPTRTVVSVDLGAGASVHQAVQVHLGAGQTRESGVVLPVAWQATGRRRLFPTFTGELEASEADDGTRLRLYGAYTVPLGVIGRVGNSVVGWRLARRSLDALLARLGRQLDTEIDRRRRSVTQDSTPDSVAPMWEHSEIYIG
jgi:hypothetical protein